ncbi:MAG TPA: hypothetical protein VMU15_04380 [Anaeromyxobacter sp.]|nr:hypothetical protein [Anaeromyxobacter sp.]
MTMEHAKAIDVLREFTRTALGRAKHQAAGCEHVLLTLAGAIAVYHDAESVRAGTREGHFISSCWFEIKGVQYLLSYSHGVGSIRSGGRQGPVDFQWTETTTEREVYDWFERKSPVPVVM